MVWVYEDSIKDTRLRKIQSFLEKKMNSKKIAEKVVKTLSLNDYLREHKWKSAEDIKNSAHIKSKPIFDDRQSKIIFRMLKQSGGTSDEAVVLDKGIRHLISYVRNYMPNVVVNVSDLAYPYVTFLKTLQSNRTIGPVVQIVKESVVQATTTGIITADTVASDIGGPVGATVVAVPAAVAALMVVITHIMEDELGEAVLASFLILPFVGPILYKAAISVGKVANKVSKGGKQLSTYRHTHSKWNKTIRKKLNNL